MTVPPPPEDCRRESRRLRGFSLIPAALCVLLLLTGHGLAALAVFWTTFSIIAIGTVIPRCQLFGRFLTCMPESESGVCLTIDDGPDPATTPALLDLLDAYQAKALFFLIGDRAAKHPDLTREILRRGHQIGNHSQTHPAGTFWTLRPVRMWQEVAGCQQTLTEILGQSPVWFRPPVGHHNLFIGPPLRALGLKMLIWNCRGFDGVEKRVPRILGTIAKDLRPGAVILLHDVTPIATEVLRGTLELIQQRGLKVVDMPA